MGITSGKMSGPHVFALRAPMLANLRQWIRLSGLMMNPSVTGRRPKMVGASRSHVRFRAGRCLCWPVAAELPRISDSTSRSPAVPSTWMIHVMESLGGWDIVHPRVLEGTSKKLKQKPLLTIEGYVTELHIEILGGVWFPVYVGADFNSRSFAKWPKMNRSYILISQLVALKRSG